MPSHNGEGGECFWLNVCWIALACQCDISHLLCSFIHLPYGEIAQTCLYSILGLVHVNDFSRAASPCTFHPNGLCFCRKLIAMAGSQWENCILEGRGWQIALRTKPGKCFEVFSLNGSAVMKNWKIPSFDSEDWIGKKSWLIILFLLNRQSHLNGGMGALFRSHNYSQRDRTHKHPERSPKHGSIRQDGSDYFIISTLFFITTSPPSNADDVEIIFFFSLVIIF